MEEQAMREHELLTKEELKDLNYTGNWELDRRRFIKEYEKNLEILSDNHNITELEYDGDF